jgi:hypothetical protein
MRSFLWFLAGLGSVLGAVTVAGGMLLANGAPQEAAAAALGTSMAVIPYVLARSRDEMGRRP